MYDQFAVELNPKLKPQEKNNEIIQNLIYSAISPPRVVYEISINFEVIFYELCFSAVEL